MKNRIFILFVLAAFTLFSACSEESGFLPDPVETEDASYLKGAKKPTSALIGQQECGMDFSTFYFVCTIDFGDLGVFSVSFVPYGPPRTYSQANVFEEDFFVHYLDSDFSNPENVVMAGNVKGTHTLANQIPDPTKFITNGKVIEACGPFADWEGCNVHTTGSVTWTPEGIPILIESTWRIN